MEVAPKSSEGEGTLTPRKLGPVFYESDSEGEDDPIVSGTITLMTAQVGVVVPQSGTMRGFHHPARLGVPSLLNQPADGELVGTKT